MMDSDESIGLRIIRASSGGLLQLIAYVIAVLGFAASFFGAAMLLSAPYQLIILALLAAAVICFFSSFFVAKIFKLSRPWNYAGLQSITTVIVVLAATSVFILQPLVPREKQFSANKMDGVEYWALSTGSTIAVRKFEAEGKRKANAVIYLHGGPGAYSVSWQPTIEVISQLASDGHDVYVYDQIGGGFSQRLEDVSQYSLNRHLDDLNAIYEKIGSDKIILIGSSWGAGLGANYMAKNPSHVSYAVFSSPGPIYHPDWKEIGDGKLDDALTPAQKTMFAAMIEKPRLFAAIALAEINPIAAARFAPDAELGSLFDQVANAFYLQAAVCDPKSIKVESSGYGFWSNRMTSKTLWDRSEDPKPALKNTHTPVLILRGECDYKKEAVAKQYGSVFPNAKYIEIEDAGHMLYMEKPDDYLREVRKFLDHNEILPAGPTTPEF